MPTYEVKFESGLGTMRIAAKDETEARAKAEKRNKYKEAFTVSVVPHNIEQIRENRGGGSNPFTFFGNRE